MESYAKQVCGKISGVSDDDFVIAAIGNIDADQALDVWTVDKTGVNHLLNDRRETAIAYPWPGK